MNITEMMKEALSWRAIVQDVLELKEDEIQTAEVVGIEIKMMLPSTYEKLMKLAAAKEVLGEGSANGKE